MEKITVAQLIAILQEQNPDAVVMIPQGYDGEFNMLMSTQIQPKKIAKWQLGNQMSLNEMGEYGNDFDVFCLG